MLRFTLFLLACAAMAQTPHAIPNGFELPNGWRITPVGKSIATEDLLLNMTVAPDGKAVIATHGGFGPHGLVVIDPATDQAVQRIPLYSTWLGLAWAPDGKKLYVSGGSANGRKPLRAPVYVFGYANGRLTEKPIAELKETALPARTYWSGVAHHPSKPLVYAANRGGSNTAGQILVYDTASGQLQKRIQVEIAPYDLTMSADGRTLWVSNWASSSVSIIDTESGKVTGRVPVDLNPNDMVMHPDGRLFVSCAIDNTVVVIDTAKRRAVRKISVALTPRSPSGSTPNALALDAKEGLLFVANADNNALAVVSVKEKDDYNVLGFIPTGWYPSSLALIGGAKPKIYVGNSKGLAAYPNPKGPHSPLAGEGENAANTIKALQKGAITVVPLTGLKTQLKAWTKQVYDNTPYKDEHLEMARAPKAASIVPQAVGVGSPIKHVIYIIKENRTYDQVMGDMPQGNGDARITIFGREITPNHHAIAEQWVLLDNLYCDGEVSMDGHSWSNSAYATDYNEKSWPAQYGGHARTVINNAYRPKLHLWDLAAQMGLTYRSYGEYATRASDGTAMEASPGVGALVGHVAPKYKLAGMRDTDNVREFIREFDQYEKNYDNPDATKRLPNLIVMSMPENHTRGTRVGDYTPRAMVANADWAVGQLVERVTHSRYWPETAIFAIEDDAQDGSDHVDARRTVGLVISPYTKRGVVDSTQYTTSSILRTIELLLGMPPMTQYDAAAMPMYASFTTAADTRPYTHLKPRHDVNAKNTKTAWGGKKSMEMNFADVDLAPMFELNEVIWKSVRGANSPMPLPVHRFRFDRAVTPPSN